MSFTTKMIGGGRVVNAIAWYDSSTEVSDRQIAQLLHMRPDTLSTTVIGRRYTTWNICIGY